MDVASKIKSLKEEVAFLNDKKSAVEKRIVELKALVEEKVKKEQLILELEKKEQELLKELGV